MTPNAPLLSFFLIATTAYAQTDTTFYNSAGGKIEKQGMSEVEFYELNNGFDRNGLVKQYYPDHSLYAEVSYVNNQSDGKYILYYKSGQIKEQRSFGNDEGPRTVTRWYQNGQKRSETEFTYQEGERIARRAQSGGLVTSRLINSWDSLGTQQVTNASGNFDAPSFTDSNYWEKGEYLNGQKVGQWSGTESGKPDYNEEYDQNGELISGVSYNEDGTMNQYEVLEQEAAYPGGLKKWVKFLRKNMKYPKVARKAKVEGTVSMTFIVDKFGIVSDVQVVSGIGSGCDEEAIRVLELSKQWTPSVRRGRNIESRMFLRLEFRLI